jgi:hypothetical protein
MAFDGNVFTTTRGNAASKDSAPPHLGSLSGSGMANAGGLAGVSGNEAVLITGPRDQKLTGTETINRTGDMYDTTTGDIDLKCVGEMNERISKDYYFWVGGGLSKTTIGETKEVYTGETSLVYKSKKEAEEPLEWFHNVNEAFSYGSAHSDTFGAYSLTGLVGLTAFGFNTDLRGADIGLKAAICEHHGTTFWMKEEEANVTLMLQRIRVTETFVMAVEPGVGAAMMHEVAVTQEILAVGSNQAI